MRRKSSFTCTLAVFLLLQGVALGSFGENSGQFDLGVAVTYSLASPTTTSHKPSHTDGCGSFGSTHQEKGTATATCTKTDDSSGWASHLSTSQTSTSDLIHTTGALVASGSITESSIARWSSAAWSRVIENLDEPSYGDLSQANPTASANVSHTSMTSYPTSSLWPSIVSAQPPTDNYTGLWLPANPSATRESSAAHTLEWNDYITLGTLICGILRLS